MAMRGQSSRTWVLWRFLRRWLSAVGIANGLGWFAGYLDPRNIYEGSFKRLPRIGSHLMHWFRATPRFATSDLAKRMSERTRFVLSNVGVAVDRLADDMRKLMMQSSIPAGNKRRQLDKERHFQSICKELKKRKIEKELIRKERGATKRRHSLWTIKMSKGVWA